MKILFAVWITLASIMLVFIPNNDIGEPCPFWENVLGSLGVAAVIEAAVYGLFLLWVWALK